VTGINWGHKSHAKKMEEEIEEMKQEQLERIQKISNHPIYKQIHDTLNTIGTQKDQPPQTKPPQTAPKTTPTKQTQPPSTVEKKESKEVKPNEAKESKPKAIPTTNEPSQTKMDITAPVLTKTSVVPAKPSKPNNDKPKSNTFFGGFVDWLVPDTPTKEFVAPEISFIKGMETPSNDESEN